MSPDPIFDEARIDTEVRRAPPLHSNQLFSLDYVLVLLVSILYRNTQYSVPKNCFGR